MAEILRVARKEFRGFFASPAAYLFLGVFLLATLFIIFWVETFFARNLADVRPLFQWLPVLLIFLVAALTMRSWSEERRAGTLESLLTAPIDPIHLVLGKFAAALGLVAVALALTLPFPVTVSVLGPLDWGPVVGGYVATLFLAAAYVSIGLYMSARTDNPIVALILTAAVCGAFYLVGSNVLTGLFDQRIAGILRLLGAGTRFESITRGVLDLRDLYYYLSIVGVFLALNRLSLERLRWGGNPSNTRHRSWLLVLGLTAANFVVADFWLAPVSFARADITYGHQYSLSATTKQTLQQLHEPLLIRGYFSAKTHPLLAPLIPQIKDLLEEYAVAAGGHARVEFVDPEKDHAAEQEAASKYGIKPVPFQTASRYQTAVVNSYFDLVIAYGDQFQTLGFRDLIEVRQGNEQSVEVMLKNPEYAITRAIRKAVNAYQAGGNPFETLDRPVTFHAYLSPDAQLPDQLRSLHSDLKSLLDDLKQKANGRLQVTEEDPDASGGKLAEELNKRFGFKPLAAGLLDPKRFWFYMVLERDGDAVEVPLPETLGKDALKRSLDAAIRRLAPGFLKTVAVYKPAEMGPPGAGGRYSHLTEALGQNVRIEDTDLRSGRVPEDADLLLVLAPKSLDDKQRFAVDQFLMRGGSVVMATSPYDVQMTQTLTASKVDSGLKDWLASYGITVEDSMTLDPRNAALPVPVQQYIGSIPVREIRMMPYPHFPDLRGDSLNADSPITANLQQLTLNWASPLTIDTGKNATRKVTTLLRSSPESWTADSLNVLPDYNAFPNSGFAASGERKPRTLAVAVEGRFESFYKSKDSPLAQPAPAPAETKKDDNSPGADKTPPKPASPVGVIESSPESAKLVIIGSNSFATDEAINLASQGLGTFYTKPVEFLQNVVDWSLEDPSLLALRGRTQLARTLDPLSESRQRGWEYANYGLALAGLFLVWAWRRIVTGADRRRHQRILAEV